MQTAPRLPSDGGEDEPENDFDAMQVLAELDEFAEQQAQGEGQLAGGDGAAEASNGKDADSFQTAKGVNMKVMTHLSSVDVAPEAALAAAAAPGVSPPVDDPADDAAAAAGGEADNRSENGSTNSDALMSGDKEAASEDADITMDDTPPPGTVPTPAKNVKNAGTRGIGKTRTSALSTTSEKAQTTISSALKSGKAVLSVAKPGEGQSGQPPANC